MLNILQCAGQAQKQRCIQPQESRVRGLSPALILAKHGLLPPLADTGIFERVKTLPVLFSVTAPGPTPGPAHRGAQHSLVNQD